MSSLPPAGEVAGPTPGPDRGLPTAPAPVPGYPGQPGGTGPDTGCLRFAVELPVPGFLVSPPQRLPPIVVRGNTPVGEPAFLTPSPGPPTPEVQGGTCPPRVSKLQPTPRHLWKHGKGWLHPPDKHLSLPPGRSLPHACTKMVSMGLPHRSETPTDPTKEFATTTKHDACTTRGPT
jgi:hypothetical protein